MIDESWAVLVPTRSYVERSYVDVFGSLRDQPARPRPCPTPGRGRCLVASDRGQRLGRRVRAGRHGSWWLRSRRSDPRCLPPASVPYPTRPPSAPAPRDERAGVLDQHRSTVPTVGIRCRAPQGPRPPRPGSSMPPANGSHSCDRCHQGRRVTRTRHRVGTGQSHHRREPCGRHRGERDSLEQPADLARPGRILP